MKNFIFLLLISYGGYQWYDSNYRTLNDYSGQDYELIMYSMTTCGNCKAKVRELKREGIEFTEYYIDKDSSKKDEFYERLAAAGFKGNRYGVPTFDANRIMLPNNPKMSLIKEKLGLE